jgi:hypothetical protein
MKLSVIYMTSIFYDDDVRERWVNMLLGYEYDKYGNKVYFDDSFYKGDIYNED